MRIQTAILLFFLLLLCGVLWFVHNPPSLPQPETAATETAEPVNTISTSTVPSAATAAECLYIPAFSGVSSQTNTVAPESGEPVQAAGTSAVPSITAETGFSKMPLFAEPLPELSVNSGSSETFRNRIITQTLPTLLAEKEGNYTNLSDLFWGDGTFSIDLHSDWATRHLFPGRTLPGLRVRIIRNPETGEYEPAGGTLILPGASLEGGYEVYPATGDSKATLQWKKSF